MAHFTPLSLDEALSAHRNGGLRVVSGGTDCYADPCLVPAEHEWLDICRIESLRGVSLSGDWVRIGATTSWAEIAAGLQGLVPASLRQAAKAIGSRQIQARATIGGNVCHASPAADGLPALLALDAHVELASIDNIRELALQDFLVGRHRTALRPNELLTCVKFRRTTEDQETAFYKFGNRRGMTIAVVSAAVSIRWDSKCLVEQARVVIGGASELPARSASLEAHLVGQRRGCLAELLKKVHIQEIAPIDDLRASAAFRRHLASVVTARACLQIERGLEDVEHLA